MISTILLAVLLQPAGQYPDQFTSPRGDTVEFAKAAAVARFASSYYWYDREIGPWSWKVHVNVKKTPNPRGGGWSRFGFQGKLGPDGKYRTLHSMAMEVEGTHTDILLNTIPHEVECL